MIRALLLLLLAILPWAAHADPRLPSGGGGGTSCLSPNNVAGATISPANFSCTLIANYTGTWRFVAGGSGPNYTLEDGGSSYGIAAASEAKLCTPPPPPRNGSVAYGYYNPYLGAQMTGSPNTYTAYTIGYSVTLQATGICSPALGYFLDKTRGYTWDTAQQSVNYATAGDTLEWKAPPAGIAYWGLNGNNMATGDITVNNLTINLDSGFHVKGVSALQPPGHDPINIGANNITIHGAGSSRVLLEKNSAGGDDAVGQIFIQYGALNPTISGVKLSWADQNVNLGGNNGTITISDVQVWYGGVQGVAGSFGQQHNFYCSNNGKSGNSGPVNMTNFQSYDVQTGGYLLKCRVDNLTVTDSYFGCTTTPSTTEPGCEMNTPIDFACGGKQTVSYSTIERDLVPADTEGSAAVMVRYAEEVAPTSKGCSQAYGTGYATNNLVIDHDIVLNDAPTWSGYPQSWAIVQMGCNNSSNGTWTTPMTCTCTVSNSVFVDNPAAGPYAGLSIGIARGTPSKCSDGGGNHYYATRTAAAAALGWSGPDQFGNPCCAFPWQPPHPTRSESGKEPDRRK